MTNEERDIITQFITRVSGAQRTPQPAFGGSVPATTQPPLPPVDRDADALIGALFQQYPEARYRLTQTAFVQEHALAEAQNRIQRLEWELQQAQQALQQAQQAAAQAAQQRPASGGIFGGLFGGGRTQAPPPPPPQGGPAWNAGGAPQQGYQQPMYQQAPPPPPQYAPGYQPGMFQQRPGGGFLGSALTTAAGVAGGLVVGNALMGMFSGHHGSDSFGGGFPQGGGFAGGGGSPWAAPQQDYVDQGTWSGGGGAAPLANQDYVDNGTWDQPAADTSWTDNSGGGGGWDSGGGGGGGSDDTF
jgi:hypothetical protein